MKARFLGSLLIAGAALAALWVSPQPAAGQGKAYVPAKAWDGHADLSGIWQARNRAYVSVEPRTPSLGMPGSTGVIVDPPDGKIPYQASAVAKKNANFANRAQWDPVNSCFMPGTPRLMYMPFPFQIIQSAKYVIIASEYAHVYRTIYTDGTKHLEGIDFWNGDSRGRWEGDSLVADVSLFNDMTWFDMAGNHHSDALHVVERYTRTADDVLTYQAVIEDPQTFTRPWTIRMPMYRLTEPNARLLEYECHSYLEDAERESAKK
jgi:hypothetical protein